MNRLVDLIQEKHIECNRKSVRVITALLAVLVAFVMLYFVAYESSHEFHECTGNDCPICHELQIAGTMIKQLAAVLAYTAISIFALFATHFVGNKQLSFHSKRNLITDKVRMDD